MHAPVVACIQVCFDVPAVRWRAYSEERNRVYFGLTVHIKD